VKGLTFTQATLAWSGMYEIDAQSFDILDAYTWIANVSEFPALDSQETVGAAFRLEYNTRQAYTNGFEWGSNDPLNATWWHLVTESFLQQPSLVSTLWQQYQSKSSILTPNCTSTECTEAKVCYIRSGSWSQAQKCQTGYDSTQ